MVIRVSSIILLLPFVLLSGCVSRRTPQKTTITYATWGEPFELPGLIKEFESTHPDIKVNLISQAFYQKVLTMIAANTPPDIMYIEAQVVDGWVKRGRFLELSPYITADNFNLDDYYRNLIEPFRYKGGIYGFPTIFSTVVMYYNKDIFDKTGVSYPDRSWTWDGFLDVSRRLTRDTNRDGRIDEYGFVMSGWINRWPIYVWQNGGRLMSDDFSRCTLDSHEAVEAIQFYGDLINKYHVSPTKAQSLELGEIEYFTTGIAAMVPATRFPVVSYRKMTRFKWDIAPMPRGRLRGNAFIGAGNSILKSTKYPKESWEFLKFLSSRDALRPKFESDKSWGIPPLKSLTEESFFLKLELPFTHGRVFLDEIPYGQFPTLGPELNEWLERLDQTLDDVWYGRRDAKDVCEEIAKKFNGMLIKKD